MALFYFRGGGEFDWRRVPNKFVHILLKFTKVLLNCFASLIKTL